MNGDQQATQPSAPATQTTPAQPQDYIRVRGPDKKIYRFRAGTDVSTMKDYFKRHGITAPQPKAPEPDRSVGAYAGETVSGVGRGLWSMTGGALQSAAEASKPRTPGEAGYNPVGLAALHIGEDVYHGLARSAKEFMKPEGGLAGRILRAGEANPFIGGEVKHAEKGGPSYFPTPESVGAAASLGTMGGLLTTSPKDVAESVAKTAKTATERSYSRSLGVKAEDVNTNPAAVMTKIVGPVMTRAAALEKATKALDVREAAKDAMVKTDTAIGKKVIGVGQIVDKEFDERINQAKAGGDPQGARKLEEEKAVARTVKVKDPVTGKWRPVPVDQGITPEQAVAKARQLHHRGYDRSIGDAATAHRAVSRNINKAMANQLGGLYEQINKEVAGLTSAKDSLKASLDAETAGAKSNLVSLYRAGLPGVGTWLALKAAGMGFGSYIGAMGMMSVWNAIGPSSLRAAAASWLVDILAGKGPKVAPAAPQQTPTGGGPVPSAAPATGAPPSPGGVPAPGAAPAGAAAPATGPAPPSVTYDPKALDIVAATNRAMGIGAPPAAPKPTPAPVTPPAPELPTGSIYHDYQNKPEFNKPLSETKKAPAPSAGPVTPRRIAEGVSGIPEELKSYVERYSDLAAKLDKASAMNRPKYEAEMKDILEYVNPKTLAARKAELKTRLDSTIRKAKSREKAASEKPVEKTVVGESTVKETGTKSFELIAPGGNIEEALANLPSVYDKISQYSEGKTITDNMKAEARASKADTVTEYNEAVNVLEFMKQHGKKLKKTKSE